jgi:hypothetical protein
MLSCNCSLFFSLGVLMSKRFKFIHYLGRLKAVTTRFYPGEISNNLHFIQTKRDLKNKDCLPAAF